MQWFTRFQAYVSLTSHPSRRAPLSRVSTTIGEPTPSPSLWRKTLVPPLVLLLHPYISSFLIQHAFRDLVIFMESMCGFGILMWFGVGKIFARKPSYDSESSSIATTASENLGSHQSDSSSAETQETVSEVTQVCCFCLSTRLGNYVLIKLMLCCLCVVVLSFCLICHE